MADYVSTIRGHGPPMFRRVEWVARLPEADLADLAARREGRRLLKRLVGLLDRGEHGLGRPGRGRTQQPGPERSQRPLRVASPHGEGLPRTKKSAVFFGWVFVLVSLGSPRVLRAHMGRSCGEPGEIELNPIGVALNGPRRVP